MTRFSRIIKVSRQRAHEGHLGLWRQLFEMIVLRTLHGVGPGYYHVAGFWRRDLSWSDKTSQSSDKAYRRQLARLNPVTYRKLSQNKIPEKAILTLFGLPTPRFLGRLEAHVGCDPSGHPLRNASDLQQLARQSRASRLVFKPLEGWGGKEVHMVQIERGPELAFREPGQENACGIPVFCAEILNIGTGGDWMVEEYFEQHPTLSALNPTSVNTVRIWVVNRGRKGCQLVLAYLRIGRRDMFVDNASSGGIVAPIDVESGRLFPARDAHRPDYRVYPRHPDLDVPIEGVVLPFWPDVRDLANQALSIFPYLRFAGLDVAIGPSGPVIQELNVSPDREGAAYTTCPSKRLLTVE